MASVVSSRLGWSQRILADLPFGCGALRTWAFFYCLFRSLPGRWIQYGAARIQTGAPVGYWCHMWRHNLVNNACSYFVKRIICSFERVNEKEIQRSSTCLITLQMFLMARAEPVLAQDPSQSQQQASRSFIQASQVSEKCPSVWAIFCLFSHTASRKLVWKWIRTYGMPMVEAVFTHYITAQSLVFLFLYL